MYHYIEIISYVILLYFIYTSQVSRKSNNSLQVAFKSILIVLGIVYITDFIKTFEFFTFEVSPWKLNCPRCDPGFNGQNVGFEYSSDTERMNQCVKSEGFCGSCTMQ